MTEHHKRAVSDVIVTLLLVGITVAGGVFVFVIFQDTQVAQQVTNEVTNPTFEGSINLIGYDTREGCLLSGLSAINNRSPCTGTADPTLTSGTDYIVLDFTNNNADSIFIDSVLVNEVEHEWNNDNGATSLSVTAGKFSIISGTNDNIVPFQSVEVLQGKDFRLVIRLDSDVPTITLNKAIRVDLNVVGFDPQQFIVTAGAIR